MVPVGEGVPPLLGQVKERAKPKPLVIRLKTHAIHTSGSNLAQLIQLIGAMSASRGLENTTSRLRYA
jgi:hypothetical protein